MGADGLGKFFHPGFSSIDELEDALGVHQGDICNSISFDVRDEKATIGVIDSVYDPPKGLDEHYGVNRTRDLLPDCSDGDTTGHGSIVSHIITQYADNVQFNLYRVAQPNGRILERHLINAIGYAHLHDDVDLLNISAGNDHSEDGSEGCANHSQPCKLREVSEKAIEDGIHIIAAAGNSQQYDSVCCPSLQDTVVSVGGLISKCTLTIPANNGILQNENQIRPPRACWTPKGDSELNYCSGKNCSPDPSHKCSDYQVNVNWSGNVDPVWNKPDILAPAAYVLTGDSPEIEPATSWSTPYVTAMAAEIIAGVRSQGKTVPTHLLRQAIRDTAKGLDSGEDLMIDAEGVMIYVFDELNLGRPQPDYSQNFDTIRDDIDNV